MQVMNPPKGPEGSEEYPVKVKMRIAKVKFSGAVFTHFFEKHDRIFGIDEGLPEGAKLLDIVYDPATDEGVAVFEHESFEAIEDVKDAPYIDVYYTAYTKTTEGKAS